jgi:hypothetical protein
MSNSGATAREGGPIADAPAQTLKHIGCDVAEALALIPAHCDAVSIMYMPKDKRFSISIHPVRGYCEIGRSASATDAVIQALAAVNARHSFVDVYDAAVAAMGAA